MNPFKFGTIVQGEFFCDLVEYNKNQEKRESEL